MRIQLDDAAQLIESIFAIEGVRSQERSPTISGMLGISDPETPDLAPQPLLIIQTFEQLENGLAYEDRDTWVRVALAANGASGNDADARQAFIDWSLGDPDEAARVWDTAKPKSGWRHFLRLVDAQDPVLAAKMRQAGTSHEFDEVHQTGALNGGRKQSKVSAARSRLRQQGMTLHRSTEGKPIMVIGGRTFDLESQDGTKKIQAYLSDIDEPLNRHGRNELVDILTGEALNAPVSSFPVRFAQEQNGEVLYLDLCNSELSVVEITADGWRIVNAAADPPSFLRPPLAQALPIPRVEPQKGSLDQLLSRHFNLPAPAREYDKEDKGWQARAGLLMAIAGWMRPSGAVPHVVFTGPNGSGKSTNADHLKGLLDPSGLGRGLYPGKVDDLFAIARAQGIVILDNISSVNEEISNALCTLSTGAALSKRALYTNADATSLQAKRPAIFTAIKSDLITRPDLAERSVQVQLAKLANRKTEAEIADAWRRDHAHFLGLICDALAEGLKELPVVECDLGDQELPRLADAALFAEAVARGLGWPRNLLLQAIEAASSAAADNLLDTDALAQIILELLDQHGGTWTGELSTLAIEFYSRPLPRSMHNNPRAIRSWIDRIEQPLRDSYGISVSYQKDPTTRRSMCTFVRRPQ
jgi:hypothetical protein